MVLKRHLFNENCSGGVYGERRSPGLPPALCCHPGWQQQLSLLGMAFGLQHPPWRGSGSPPACTHPGQPRGGERLPPAPRGSIIAQRSHFAFIAFIYYPGASACFLRQLSGYIVADKQCWSVFIRQPKFITFHLFIYLVGLWWWPVFFFQ